MKYVLIGCGRISPNHVEAAAQNSLEVVGLCDLNLNQIKLLKQKCPRVETVKEYINYKDMIKKERPDIVAIATESGNHGEIAKNVIKMGCNVIIEKPISLSLNEIEEIKFLASEYDVKVASCHQNIFNKYEKLLNPINLVNYFTLPLILGGTGMMIIINKALGEEHGLKMAAF